MDSIGAEVGQKMRSAIKAKLLELNCYVDDELPDYIMVMVANKRTKSQMNEDLGLFLSTKTSPFVEWLHIVLKKLREVTVTNPEVYKKVAKRKSSDYPDCDIKKEKKHMNIMLKCENESSYEHESQRLRKSTEHRKVTVLESQREENYDDNFDIPLLSHVNLSSQEDLESIERKIKSVKSRLGLLVDSDDESEMSNKKDVEEDNLDDSIGKHQEIITQDILASKLLKKNITQDNDETDMSENMVQKDEKRKHTPITFDVESSRKPSVLDRLGRRSSPDHKRIRLDKSNSRDAEERSRGRKKEYKNISSSKDRRSREKRSSEKKSSSLSDTRKDRNKGVLSRLGVMSKISIPQKEHIEYEPKDELKTREVRSMVQVKPRIIPTDVPQPNKSLLLKAVAEAQRSIAQTPNVGKNSKHTSSLAHIKGKLETKREEHALRKLSQNEKNKLRNIVLAQISQTTHQVEDDDNKAMCLPKPSTSISSRKLSENDTQMGQHFIVTVGGVEETRCRDVSSSENTTKTEEEKSRVSAKSRLDMRKLSSPVTFDNLRKKITTKSIVPDKLPLGRTPQSMKNIERCKYWPNCRNGDKCEFIHPVTNCEMFPHCQFRDQCIYLHPNCKFGSSCTKRDCPYSHVVTNKAPVMTKGYLPIKMNNALLQNCKYFPQCTNPTCPYFHPKPCKYGKYCKNPAVCTFSHNFLKSKSSLSWRAK